MATADDILSTLNIEIRGIGLVNENVPATIMLMDVVGRAAGYGASAKKITITVNEAERDGSRMYVMCVEYANGGEIHIGAIRRTPHAETEFHS